MYFVFFRERRESRFFKRGVSKKDSGYTGLKKALIRVRIERPGFQCSVLGQFTAPLLTLVLFRSRNGYERSVRQIVRSLPGKQIYVPLYKSLPRSSFFSLPRKKSLVLGRIIISSLVPISLSKHAPNYLLYPKIKHYWLVSFGKAVHNVIFLSVFLFFHQSFIDHAVFVRLSSVHKHC